MDVARKLLRSNKLEDEHRRIMETMPEEFRRAQDVLREASPAEGTSGVIIRTYTTYSAYEDPITD
jgi:hypothetical protein